MLIDVPGGHRCWSGLLPLADRTCTANITSQLCLLSLPVHSWCPNSSPMRPHVSQTCRPSSVAGVPTLRPCGLMSARPVVHLAPRRTNHLSFLVSRSAHLCLAVRALPGTLPKYSPVPAEVPEAAAAAGRRTAVGRPAGRRRIPRARLLLPARKRTLTVLQLGGDFYLPKTGRRAAFDFASAGS